MDIEAKVDLVKMPPTEEIITENELLELFKKNDKPRHYIGLETSWLLHLGHMYGIGAKLKDFIKAGIDCTLFIADWHSWINNKLSGDMEKIKASAKYYEEAFNFFVGPKLKFVLGSELYHNNDAYWERLIRIAKATNLNRVKRCLTIAGRKESEALDFAQFMYAPMQVADIFALDVDIVHAGMDQRKAHVLAREIAQKMKWKVPVAIHNHLLGGLSKPESIGFDENKKMDIAISSKMSKSKPGTAIFIHDTEFQIREKLQKAWCPEKEIEFNPLLDLVKNVILHEKKIFRLERPERFGGNVEFDLYDDIIDQYAKGKIHPQDLKANVARDINEIIAPLRSHFEKKPELLRVFKEAEVTR